MIVARRESKFTITNIIATQCYFIIKLNKILKVRGKIDFSLSTRHRDVLKAIRECIVKIAVGLYSRLRKDIPNKT